MAAIFAAVYFVAGRKSRQGLGVIPYVFLLYFSCTLTLLLACILTSTPLIPPVPASYPLTPEQFYLQEYLVFIGIAVVSTIFGHTLYNYSLEYVRASLASVALLAEPLFSTVFAFLIPWINQIPSIYTIFGGFIILSGIYLTSKNISF